MSTLISRLTKKASYSLLTSMHKDHPFVHSQMHWGFSSFVSLSVRFAGRSLHFNSTHHSSETIASLVKRCLDNSLPCVHVGSPNIIKYRELSAQLLVWTTRSTMFHWLSALNKRLIIKADVFVFFQRSVRGMRWLIRPTQREVNWKGCRSILKCLHIGL